MFVTFWQRDLFGILIVIRLCICVLIAYLALDDWVPNGASSDSFDFLKKWKWLKQIM